ncbi:unnamed protein product [Auanema sp. JU1783]|nr:unnamed protein product [Auanema sp. JU1783]
MEKSTIAGGLFLFGYVTIAVYFFCWLFLLPFFPWFTFLFPPVQIGLIISYSLFLGLLIIVVFFIAVLYVHNKFNFKS